MTEFIRDRRLITATVLEQLTPDYTSEHLQESIRTWWSNLRSGGGLGLTDRGFDAFVEAEIESWTVELKPETAISSHTALLLDKSFPCPYYFSPLNVRKVKKFVLYLFDSRVFVMIQLHGGIEEYLKRIAKR